MSADYEKTIDWLFQQFPSYQSIGANAYKPNLDNISKLCEAFGNPQNKLTFIHVAGTNGKGSTCSMLASILKEAGYKTGLFTSPHILDFRERIRINGKCVDETFIIAQTKAIQEAKLDFEPSFFEISFLLALLYFRQEKCAICVIETGLGGRLDATNIITPILSLITNISIEHTQFLGNNVTSIATEKAGIIKPKVPVIIGERQTMSEEVFVAHAKAKESKILFADDQLNELPENFPLLGAYQQRNYNLVLKALRALAEDFPVTSNAIALGLQNLSQNSGLVARLQVMNREPLTIYDVSHNVAGIEKTLETIIEMNHGQLHIVYGTSADKDLDGIFELFPKESNYFFTEFTNARSARIAALKEKAEEYQLHGVFFEEAKNALASAQQLANEKDTILVFGSFFLIADLI